MPAEEGTETVNESREGVVRAGRVDVEQGWGAVCDLGPGRRVISMVELVRKGWEDQPGAGARGHLRVCDRYECPDVEKVGVKGRVAPCPRPRLQKLSKLLDNAFPLMTFPQPCTIPAFNMNRQTLMAAPCTALWSWTLRLHVDKVRYAVEATINLKALQVCPSLHTSTAHFPGLSHNDQQIGTRGKTITT